MTFEQYWKKTTSITIVDPFVKQMCKETWNAAVEEAQHVVYEQLNPVPAKVYNKLIDLKEKL